MLNVESHLTKMHLRCVLHNPWTSEDLDQDWPGHLDDE